MTDRNAWTIGFVTLVLGVALGTGIAVSVLAPSAPSAEDPGFGPVIGDSGDLVRDDGSIQQFGSEAAFAEYVRAGAEMRNYGFGGGIEVVRGGDVLDAPQTEDSAGGDAAGDGDGGTPTESGTQTAPDRVGETNVQVEGLDEPDLVKTDGEHFYYSPGGHYYVPRTVERGEDGEEVYERMWGSHVVDIRDPAAPSEIGRVGANGQLLQTGDTLVVFDEQERRIVGYDVSDPENPTERWNKPLEDRLVTVRETDGQLYVVTRTYVEPTTCPIEPMGPEHSIECGDVFAPSVQTAADVTYTAFSIDAASGEVDDSLSFVGTGPNSVVYMAEGSLYVTYTTHTSEADLRVAWASQSGDVPGDLAGRILEIDSYDISDRSKEREIRRAISNWAASLPEEEREERLSELTQSFEDFVASHQTELVQTSIVRVGVADGQLAIDETGTVPGEPLNQFALDEYEGTLRVTTTIPRTGGAESFNNMYVLDGESMEQVDQVTGMGEGQRVYAVRYVGDTAYVVTFRQVDPFYVIDFEEPRDPELLGELKLPGFSTYLHPVDDQEVLGIGREDRQVKAVLFDVTDPTDPVVGDDLVLEESFSAIDQSHHAFMIDRRHEVFFLPAGNTGTVVDYSDGEVDVVAEIEAEAPVTRARYVDDYLYVFAGPEVIVVDQNSWERVETLQLEAVAESG